MMAVSRYIEHDGRRLHVAEWSRITGVHWQTILSRINRFGWPVAKAISTPAWSSTAKETHGLAGTPEYKVWKGIRRRCRGTTDHERRYYTARGISVCEEWSDFAVFFAHVGKRPSPKHEIDRIDNNKGYEPGNVRWATREVNVGNRRNTKFATFRGETMTVAEWSRRLGIRRVVIAARLKRWGECDRVFTAPIARRRSAMELAARIADPSVPRSRLSPAQRAARSALILARGLELAGEGG